MRKTIVAALATFSLALCPVFSANADDGVVKVGLVLPLTGFVGLSGQQVAAGAKLYMDQHGDTVAGQKIELILKDDGGAPDIAKRLTQELVVNDQVDILGGYGLTPLALSSAPIVTQSQTPAVIMVAATSSVIDASPFFVRSSFTMPQVVYGVAKWAPENDIKRVVTLVTDYAPGHDTEKAFAKHFEKAGGEVVDTIRVPMKNPDFSPALQRVRDAEPDALFVFVAESQGLAVLKQFFERGLDKAGIKLIGTGDMLGDDIINDVGDVAVGMVTSHHYSAAHPSELNKRFVADYKAANRGRRPNFMVVAGYDGMQLIYKALEATNGEARGEELLEAMKGLQFESPRGPVTIDPDNGDIIQNVYLREVQLVDGELYNVEFDQISNLKDPK